MFYDIIKTVDETIQDEEIRQESKEVLKKINNELVDVLNFKKVGKPHTGHQEEE